jgi:hypothetical protein
MTIDVQSRIISRNAHRLVFNGDPGWDDRRSKRTGRSIKSIAVVEMSPSVRTVRWDQRVRIGTRLASCGCCRENVYQTKRGTYTLALPYLQFWTIVAGRGGSPDQLQRSRVLPYLSWRPKPLKSIEGKIQSALLPNVYKDCNVCLGEYSELELSRDPYRFVELFWTKKFTPGDDDWPCHHRLPDAGLNSFEEWSELSKKDPSFVLNLLGEFFPKWNCSRAIDMFSRE